MEHEYSVELAVLGDESILSFVTCGTQSMEYEITTNTFLVDSVRDQICNHEK